MKKKSRIVGTESYYSSSTGEIREMQIMEYEDTERDSNFHKLFLKDFLAVLGLVSSQKTSILCFILSNLNRGNLFFYTYRQIADMAGVSYKTVADTMKALQDADFLRRHTSGHYMVNPDIIFKGSYQRRCAALAEYRDCTAGDRTSADELRLQKIQKGLSRLGKAEKRIRQEIALRESFQDGAAEENGTGEQGQK